MRPKLVGRRGPAFKYRSSSRIHGLEYTLFDGLLVYVTGGMNTGVAQDALDDDRLASRIS